MNSITKISNLHRFMNNFKNKKCFKVLKIHGLRGVKNFVIYI